ncbi:MAG: hypothetical protein IJ740_03440 [Ruminococcus sp.]|nr:hypothetical protein [Ruminococcus sp.]
MNDVKLNEVLSLIDMYLENISEDIDRTRESIARLEGKLTALNIERGRLESIQKRFNGGESGSINGR